MLTLCACATVPDGDGKTSLPIFPAGLADNVPLPPARPGNDARQVLAETTASLRVCNARLGNARGWYDGVRKTFATGR